MRSLESFDQMFAALTKRALLAVSNSTPGGAPLFKIPCKSRGGATNLMMQLRQYWKVLAREYRLGNIPEYDERAILARHCEQLAVRADGGNKFVVEVVHRSQLSTSRAIADALGAMGDAIKGAHEPKELNATAQELAAQAAARAAAEPKSAQDTLLDEVVGDAQSAA